MYLLLLIVEKIRMTKKGLIEQTNCEKSGFKSITMHFIYFIAFFFFLIKK